MRGGTRIGCECGDDDAVSVEMFSHADISTTIELLESIPESGDADVSGKL